MSLSFRIILLGIAIVALVGCNQYSFGSGESSVESVDQSTVVRELQYFDNNTEGPLYEVSLTVPDGWVGEFEILDRGNSLVFRYLKDEDTKTGAPIFYLEALSNAQYWEQIGSYPGQYVNIANTADTYFIYHLPIDPFYSGLDEDEYEELADQVPDVIGSFEAVRVDD